MSARRSNEQRRAEMRVSDAEHKAEQLRHQKDMLALAWSSAEGAERAELNKQWQSAHSAWSRAAREAAEARQALQELTG